MSVTVMRLRVSVPVLSLQMTVVLPSASAAGRCRTMALRRAMRLTPMARVMVTAAGSPSGMTATARAIAAVNISVAASPRSNPMANVMSARMTMPTVRNRLKRLMRRVSGVARSAASPTRRWMRPISVSAPVPITRPSAVPDTTSVPAYAMLPRSASRAPPGTTAGSLPDGRDSPVSIDSSTLS